MNSFLQALYQMKEFREDLIELESKVQEKNQKLLDKVKLSLYQLQRLFAQLYGSARPVIAPNQLRVSLPDFFKNWEQHDSSEFAKLLLDKIENELKQCEAENLIGKYIEGIKVNYLKCLTCNFIKEQKENFIDIGVNLDKDQSAHMEVKNIKALINESLGEEVFEGDNQYYCDNCQAKVEKAIKYSKIERLPEYLIVTIYRFQFEMKSLTKIKLLNPCEVLQQISFDKEQMSDQDSPDCDTFQTYELQSVIIHSWRIFNDASVTQIKDISYLSTIQKQAINKYKLNYDRNFPNDTPYMAIYKRRGQNVEMKNDFQVSKADQEEVKQESIIKQEFKLPQNLQEFIDKDNKAYIEEEKNKKNQKAFNYQLLQELQRSLSSIQNSKEIDDYNKKWNGGGGGFGGPSMGAGGFFGGSGFIS
ncbi:ubiquitin carboxyl-terminal hydrolase family protein [Stylonychia lemnae]|uniref:Ubiquitin carboxyl-terminal hydrolase family protein n=1 Tax=Stylonychia lemnae TaxID=5949 RepID=A0A078BB86_STYLE|nr:ubiquitin carboxyl-terminal hydrolase family protein [Stylonychia lemnae]|eukprot:CDW91654.1 ubiquitin carboxyl-terminal hydrolase family protein [Stylonychia lemnae]